jgi:hypothetical protein
MSPFIFMPCECGKSIHIYIPKEKFFKEEIEVSGWQVEYSEKVRGEKFEESKRFAEKLNAEFVDAKSLEQVTCSNCGRVYSVSDLKQGTQEG